MLVRVAAYEVFKVCFTRDKIARKNSFDCSPNAHADHAHQHPPPVTKGSRVHSARTARCLHDAIPDRPRRSRRGISPEDGFSYTRTKNGPNSRGLAFQAYRRVGLGYGVGVRVGVGSVNCTGGDAATGTTSSGFLSPRIPHLEYIVRVSRVSLSA